MRRSASPLHESVKPFQLIKPVPILHTWVENHGVENSNWELSAQLGGPSRGSKSQLWDRELRARQLSYACQV